MKKPASIVQQIHDLAVDVRELIERGVVAFERKVEIDGRRLELEEHAVATRDAGPLSESTAAGLVPTELDQAAARQVVAGAGAPWGPDLLTKREGAELLRMSERTFERKVMKEVTAVASGGRKLYRREELERWAKRHEVGPSARTSARGSSSSGSATAAKPEVDPQVKRLADELKRRQRASSQRSSRTRRPKSDE